MLKLSDFAAVGRPVRQDDWESLGDATSTKIKQAIEEGRFDDARALVDYMIAESKGLHDLMCDWVWSLLTKIASEFGENAMFEVLKASQVTSSMKQTWKGFLKLSVEERVQLTAEIMRSHRCGPDQDGRIVIVEDHEKYSIQMDPCGSGGRMRRGDPVNNSPSRLGPPYNYGTTKNAHDWSWQKKDVPYYCLHCAANELLSIEWGSHPLWVTRYDEDSSKPCHWDFYKSADAIPEQYYSRLGKKKPPGGTGRY